MAAFFYFGKLAVNFFSQILLDLKLFKWMFFNMTDLADIIQGLRLNKLIPK